MERKFNKILKLELLKARELNGREPDHSERSDIVDKITARLAFLSKEEGERRDKACENRIKELSNVHDACAISLRG